MELEVDLKDVEFFINNKLGSLLIENTTDFNTAAFILQASIDALATAKKSLENS